MPGNEASRPIDKEAMSFLRMVQHDGKVPVIDVLRGNPSQVSLQDSSIIIDPVELGEDLARKIQAERRFYAPIVGGGLAIEAGDIGNGKPLQYGILVSSAARNYFEYIAGRADLNLPIGNSAEVAEFVSLLQRVQVKFL